MDLLILQGKGSAGAMGTAVPTWRVSILCYVCGRAEMDPSGRRKKFSCRFLTPFKEMRTPERLDGAMVILQVLLWQEESWVGLHPLQELR